MRFREKIQALLRLIRITNSVLMSAHGTKAKSRDVRVGSRKHSKKESWLAARSDYLLK
jgi:hypothetical protein